MSRAASRALAAVRARFQVPVCAVESSSEMYLTLNCPALPRAWASASFAPLTIACAVAAEVPVRGMLE